MNRLKRLDVTYDLNGDKLKINVTTMGTVNIAIEQADGGMTAISLDEEDLYDYAQSILSVHHLMQGGK
jgi:hypothetical protein